MSEQAGRKASISIVGNPVVSDFEPMIDISPLLDGTIWQVSNINKRLLDKNASYNFYINGGGGLAEVGTTTTNIKKTAHGLITGDAISNGSIFRTVTRVDNDNLTVTAIAGQTSGQTIILYKKLIPKSINYVAGAVTTALTYSVAFISTSYLPKTLVATANDYSYSQSTDMGDVTPFLATHKKRMPLLKQASGTLSYWDITDPYFTDALLADTPKYVILEDGISQKALLAYFDKTELKASIGNPQNMTVGFINTNSEVG